MAVSSALTCPSQLGRGTSANERTEGGAEVGGAGLYKVCVRSVEQISLRDEWLKRLIESEKEPVSEGKFYVS